MSFKSNDDGRGSITQSPAHHQQDDPVGGENVSSDGAVVFVSMRQTNEALSKAPNGSRPAGQGAQASDAPSGGYLACDLLDDDTKPNLELFRLIRQDLVGANMMTTTPHGEKPLVYADWTASGRALGRIEDVIKNEVLRSYANTHTETSYTGAQTTKYRDQAREAVLASVGGDPDLDCVLFAGSGSSAAIDKLQRVMGMTSSPIRPKLGKSVVVFVSVAEHHSNLLSWRQCGCHTEMVPIAADGLICTETLKDLLLKHASKKLKIGSFSAASNITGIKFQVKKITAMLHAHGALAFWDFAAAGPYVDIRVTDSENVEYNLDAVFLSPHKFVGAAGGTPGVLVAKRRLFSNDIPTFAGGGTVKWVYSLDKYSFDPTIENREEGGTPAIVATIRCGLVFKLKDKVGSAAIHARELKMIDLVRAHWEDHPNIMILGGLDAKRLAIFSFMIKPPNAGRCQWLHYNYVCTLLNDLFGIQSRGGCSCAGPYGAYLLGIPDSIVPHAIPEYLKPGWVRVSLNYFISDHEAEYIVEAVKLVAEKGHLLLPYYKFNEENGKWSNTSRGSIRLKSLADLDLLRVSIVGGNKAGSRRESTMHLAPGQRQAAEDTRHNVMRDQLQAARLLIERVAAAAPPAATRTCPKAQADEQRWYMLPGDVLGEMDNAFPTGKWETGVEYLPSLTRSATTSTSYYSSIEIDGRKAPFLSMPWYSTGSRVAGRVPGKTYMNENAVRARAGFLNATGWISAFLILFLPDAYGIRPFTIIKYLAGVALWEMVAAASFGLTPFAPYGVLATLITISQPPIWKPAAPKRFAWCLGVMLLGGCFLAGALQKRWFAFGLAVACILLTAMEAWFGFCMGCWMYNLGARALGQEECKECIVSVEYSASSISRSVYPADPQEMSAVKSLLAEHPTVMFTKANCRYCEDAEKHFEVLGYDYHIVRLDSAAGYKYTAALSQMTSQSTVPYIFVNGKFVGGASDLIGSRI